jgi:N-acetyltransferase
MIDVRPVTLEGHGVRLEPMAVSHAPALAAAVRDGALWELWYTGVPRPEAVDAYIEQALAGQAAGHMLPWVVRELATDTVVGSTRYHDIVARLDRVEVGYTFYARSWQKTHVNTACKLMLFRHAFEALGCAVVALRTDNFNFQSQRAIEALGAKKDGVLRHHAPRPDGSIRDTHLYSILAHEWSGVRCHLEWRIQRLAPGSAPRRAS